MAKMFTYSNPYYTNNIKYFDKKKMPVLNVKLSYVDLSFLDIKYIMLRTLQFITFLTNY